MLVVRLDEKESAFALQLESEGRAGGTKDQELDLRSSVLQALLLQRQVDVREADGTYSTRDLKISETGIVINDARIVSEEGGYTHDAVLNLADASLRDGHTLPPLTFSRCKFPGTIRLSRARFRALSFQDCELVHLRGNGLRVEGTLNLSNVRSACLAPDQRIKIQLGGTDTSTPGLSEEVTGARVRHLEATERTTLIDVLPGMRLREPALRCIPNADHIQYPLCWIELRNAQIGIDVDVCSAKLVAPEPFSAPGMNGPSDINGPHARYALDLHGCTIRGRLKMNPDSPGIGKRPLQAVGGVSIVRSLIEGSVCGSGVNLTAIEGSALAAQRSRVRGQVLLNAFEDENQFQNVVHARGYVDFTSAEIGASLSMSGAQLSSDDRGRAGLMMSRAQVGDGLLLQCAVSRCETEMTPFCSDGGVRLDNAVVKGILDMTAANLKPSSFGHSLYAAGLFVGGLSSFSCLRKKNATKHQLKDAAFRFTATAPLVLVSAKFARSVNFRGADLSLTDMRRRADVRPCCIDADLLKVEGTLWLDTADASIPSQVRADVEQPAPGHRIEFPVRTEIRGTVRLRQADISVNLRLSGARLAASVGERIEAIDLNCARIRGSLFMDAANTERATLFESRGSIMLEGAEIGDEWSMKGALVRAIRPTVVQQQLFGSEVDLTALHRPAIRARNLHVTGRAKLGVPHDEPEGPNWELRRNQLCCTGFLDFSKAAFPAGLYLNSAIIEQYPSTAQTDGMNSTNWSALEASGGTFSTIELRDAKFTYSLHMTHIKVQQVLNAHNVTICAGTVDFWESSFGSLYLEGISFIELPPVANHRDRRFRDNRYYLEDVLHLGGCTVEGKLRIFAPKDEKGKSKEDECPDGNVRFVNLRNCQVETMEDDRGSGWGKGRKLKLEGFVCKRAPNRGGRYPQERGALGRLLTWRKTPNTFRRVLKALLVLWVFTAAVGAPRSLTHLKSHFNLEILPSKDPPLENKLRRPGVHEVIDIYSAPAPLNPLAGRLLPTEILAVILVAWSIPGLLPWLLKWCYRQIHPGDSDAHIDWLERQLYWVSKNPARATISDQKVKDERKNNSGWLKWHRSFGAFLYRKARAALGMPHVSAAYGDLVRTGFTPAAYDHIARQLREEGRDREAKRILSAKFTRKRQLDVPLYSKPVWLIYDHLFNYGLTSTKALITFLCCILLGNVFAHEAAREHRLVAIARSRVDPDKAATARHVCTPPQTFLFAMEVFVPVIKFVEPKPCELVSKAVGEAVARNSNSPQPSLSKSMQWIRNVQLSWMHGLKRVVSSMPFTFALGDDPEWARDQIWHIGEALYAILGFFVTSVTLLTIPGVLRNRADG